jgi:hypothetical protein
MLSTYPHYSHREKDAYPWGTGYTRSENSGGWVRLIYGYLVPINQPPTTASLILNESAHKFREAIRS